MQRRVKLTAANPDERPMFDSTGTTLPGVRWRHYADADVDQKTGGSPAQILNKLGYRAGELLDIHIENGSIVLTPQKKARPKVKIITDPATGLVLTSEEVAEMLVDFP